MFMVIIITTLVFDTSIIKTYDLISKKETSSLRISIFVIIVIICIVGQYFLLEFVGKSRIKGILTIKGISAPHTQTNSRNATCTLSTSCNSIIGDSHGIVL